MAAAAFALKVQFAQDVQAALKKIPLCNLHCLHCFCGVSLSFDFLCSNACGTLHTCTKQYCCQCTGSDGLIVAVWQCGGQAVPTLMDGSCLYKHKECGTSEQRGACLQEETWLWFEDRGLKDILAKYEWTTRIYRDPEAEQAEERAKEQQAGSSNTDGSAVSVNGIVNELVDVYAMYIHDAADDHLPPEDVQVRINHLRVVMASDLKCEGTIHVCVL